MININLKSGGKFPVDLIWLPMLTRSGPHVSQIDLIKRKPYPSSPGADKLDLALSSSVNSSILMETRKKMAKFLLTNFVRREKKMAKILQAVKKMTKFTKFFWGF